MGHLKTKTTTRQLQADGDFWRLDEIRPGTVFRWAGNTGGRPEVMGIVPDRGSQYGGKPIELRKEEHSTTYVFVLLIVPQKDGTTALVARYFTGFDTVQIATEVEIRATFEGGPG